MNKPAADEKKLLTVREAITAFGLSRRKMFRLAETEGLSFMAYYGTRKLIIRDEFIKYLEKPGVKEKLTNGTKKRLEA